MAFQPRPADIVIDVGGDTWKRYGRLTQTSWPADRHGEDAKETHTRASVGGLITNGGLFNPAGNNVPRLTWIKDANGLYQPRLLLEAAATNVVLWNRDVTNAAWVKVSVTPALDQVGLDGVANTASSLLA